MAKRNLTEEEKRLWHHYTRDVKKLSTEMKMPEVELNPKESKNNKRFNIKIPKAVPAKKNSFTQFSNHETLKNKDHNWSKKLKGGKVRPEGKIDLHGMTCAEAHEKLYNYLERASAIRKTRYSGDYRKRRSRKGTMIATVFAILKMVLVF